MDAVGVIIIITAIQIWTVCQLYILKNIARVARWFVRVVLKDEENADKG